jgi:rhodanese-related sulfurtransferase
MNKKILVWVACGAAVIALLLAVTTPAASVLKKVDGAEVLRLQASGALVVDVRTASEYAQGHIASSINAPVDQIQQASAAWSKTQPIVVYCATGARSANAAAYLSGQGFAKVYDLAGGIAEWTGSLVDGSGQTTSGLTVSAGLVKTGGKPVFIDFASST